MTLRATFLIALAVFSLARVASPAPLEYEGTLEYVPEDTGGLKYSGTSLGTPFTISIDDVRADGSFDAGTISDGTTSCDFSCPGPTGQVNPGECSDLGSGPSFDDDVTLTASLKTQLNAVFGPGTFPESEDIVVDMVNIEGASATSGGQIEVGFTFVFDAATYDQGTSPSFEDMMPAFDASLASHALFFIDESVEGSDDGYLGLGATTAPVQLPALSPWAHLVAMACLLTASCLRLRSAPKPSRSRLRRSRLMV